MARKPYWQNPSIRQNHNDTDRQIMRQLLESQRLLHLNVLSRGNHLVIFSDDQGEKLPRIRFTRIDVTKDGRLYELGIANHSGRWESTPFTGTIAELFAMVTEQLGWLLEDY